MVNLLVLNLSDDFLLFFLFIFIIEWFGDVVLLFSCVARNVFFFDFDRVDDVIGGGVDVIFCGIVVL